MLKICDDMEIKDINGNSIELKFVEAKPQELSKKQLQSVLAIYSKALEIACEDILFEQGDFANDYRFEEKHKREVMYYIDQANEFYAKKEN